MQSFYKKTIDFENSCDIMKVRNKIEFSDLKVCIFIQVKIQALFSIQLLRLIDFVSRQRSYVFFCVASATHFFIRGICCEKVVKFVAEYCNGF